MTATASTKALHHQLRDDDAPDRWRIEQVQLSDEFVINA
ncbi:hypothetical protein Syncc8109_1725 [Synechococcus sp. WH 8109]|nr:hypothetical protein Syncc8109_1725 [Synechococcus sp. WH 8109]